MSIASRRTQLSIALGGLAVAGMVGSGLIAPMLANAAPTASPRESAQPTPAATAEAAESSPAASPTASQPSSASPASPSVSASADPGKESSGRPTTSGSATPSPTEPSPTDPAETTPPESQTIEAAVVPPVSAQAEGEGDITLSKSAAPSRVSRVGQVVSYRFVAKNTGSADLENVAITDELQDLGPLSCNRPTPATVPVGATLTCTASLTVSQATLDFGDIYNFATVYGEVPGVEGAEPESVGANAAATVQVDQHPAVGLRASVSPSGKADLGDRLSFSATLTNTGNVTLSSAKVSSNIDADWTCPTTSATFAPGAELQCSGSYRVARADARRGAVAAVITGAGWSPYSEQRVTDTDRINIEVTKLPTTDADTGSTSGGLADTGAPAGGLVVALAGVAAAATGAGLLLRRSRSRR